MMTLEVNSNIKYSNKSLTAHSLYIISIIRQLHCTLCTSFTVSNHCSKHCSSCWLSSFSLTRGSSIQSTSLNRLSVILYTTHWVLYKYIQGFIALTTLVSRSSEKYLHRGCLCCVYVPSEWLRSNPCMASSAWAGLDSTTTSLFFSSSLHLLFNSSFSCSNTATCYCNHQLLTGSSSLSHLFLKLFVLSRYSSTCSHQCVYSLFQLQYLFLLIFISSFQSSVLL